MKSIVIVLVFLCAVCHASDFYVATNGSDANPGTEAQPFLTLEAARDAIRGSGGTVYLRGGTHYRTNVFSLASADAATESDPVSYRNYIGEAPILSGAKPITNFVAVTDEGILGRLKEAARTHTLVADLSDLNIANYGSLTNRGATVGTAYSGYTRPWMIEVFYDGSRQQLSRWPNQDHSGEVWAWTTTPVPAGDDQLPTANWFTYIGDEPDSWALTEPVWVHGGWTTTWAYSYEQVTQIGASTNAFITDRPGDYGYEASSPYEALNVLEELDQAGEWVIDPANDLLYFWPPGADYNSKTFISCLDTNLISINAAHYTTLQGLTLECARGSGIEFVDSDTNNVLGCVFRDLGNAGIIVGNALFTNRVSVLPVAHDYHGGSYLTISGCEFSNLGEGGIALSGGYRETLTGSGHIVTNCYFHSYNVNVRNYRPAVRIDGVGSTVTHCVMHTSPHQAIWFSGNDHIIEYCHIYNVCRNTSDAGAIYAVSADWKQRGTEIRYNLIEPSANYAVYLDDFTCGTKIFGNIVMVNSMGILIGGGRDNEFANNIVFGYSSSGWQVSNRGITWADSSIEGLIDSVKQVDYTNAPYSKYVGMTDLHDDIAAYEADPTEANLDEVAYASGNSIWTNIFLRANPYSAGDIDTNRIAQAVNYYYSSYATFTGFTDGLTKNAFRNRAFELKNDSDPVLAGFIDIPFTDIGVTADAYGVVDPDNIAVYPAQPERAPYLGSALAIPGTIQIEDYDLGIPGVTFTNTYATHANWNNGGSYRYRHEAEFDIWASLSGGVLGYVLDISSLNSWLEYTVSIAPSGQYLVTFVFGVYSSGQFTLTVDGVSVATGLTGSSPTAVVSLSSGEHVLRLTNTSGGASRIGSMTFTKLGGRATATSLRIGAGGMRGP